MTITPSGLIGRSLHCRNGDIEVGISLHPSLSPASGTAGTCVHLCRNVALRGEAAFEGYSIFE